MAKSEDKPAVRAVIDRIKNKTRNKRPAPPLPKVYLAGKMGEKNRIWHNHHSEWHEYDEPWPLENISGRVSFIWVGPFTMRCDHGCSHGPLTFHKGQACWEPATQTDIVNRCLSAINEADLFCAHIETADAFGTLVEIGYALALNKTISLSIDAGLVHQLQRSHQWPREEFGIWFDEGYHYNHDLWFVMRAVGLKGRVCVVETKDAMEFHETGILSWRDETYDYGQSSPGSFLRKILEENPASLQD